MSLDFLWKTDGECDKIKKRAQERMVLMERKNNYVIMARQAQERFLTYNQEVLIHKLHLKYDAQYLYTSLFGIPYRLDRKTGLQERLEGSYWVDANDFGQVLTLLDLLCDSRENRSVSGRYQTLQSFGHQFHQTLVEERPSEAALAFDRNPQGFAKACEAFGGKPYPGADVSYVLPVFEELTLVVQLWRGDAEFAPRLRYLWDSNANQYLRYETMYYAIGVLEAWLLPMV